MSDISTQTQYRDFVISIKEQIRTAKTKATLSVNRQLIELYFSIGKEIVSKQQEMDWGRSVVEKMAKDLQSEFGKRSGFSSQNLWYMRQFYITYCDATNLQQLVGEIP